MKRKQDGFTLPEVIATMAVISIALVALASVIPVGMFAVHEGNQLSTATFLADQRLEQVRNAVWSVTPVPPSITGNDCVGLSLLATVPPTVPVGFTCTQGGAPIIAGTILFPDETAAQIAGFTGYSRTVRVTDCGVAPGCTGITNAAMRSVTVTVTYTPMTGRGMSPTTKAAVVTTIVARH